LLDILWFSYYPQAANYLTDAEYYLASSQLATMQNLTDLIINLHFFILPRIGYSMGITEVFKTCCKGTSHPGNPASSGNRSSSQTGKSLNIHNSKQPLLVDTNLGVDLTQPLLGSPSSFLMDFSLHDSTI